MLLLRNTGKNPTSLTYTENKLKTRKETQKQRTKGESLEKVIIEKSANQF